MSKLYILTGIPASGKSTYVEKHMNPKTDTYVSRDEVREWLFPEGQYYYYKPHEMEELVFKKYIELINIDLIHGYNVYADATHLTKKIRKEVLKRVSSKADMIESIYIDSPLQKCLAKNLERTGRRKVPTERIIEMHNKLQKPTLEEGFDYVTVVSHNY
jgi:predicted kinase